MTGRATTPGGSRGTAVLAAGLVLGLVLIAGVVLPTMARTPAADDRQVAVQGTTGDAAAISAATTQETRFLDPRATYLHTNQDDSANARAFRLSDLGVEPTETVRITRLGDFENGQEQAFGLTAVFSTNDTLLPRSERDRVPGAVDAGDDFVTSPTFNGNEETDIPEDFQVSTQDGSTASTTVTVPADARFIFLSAQDNLFQDNSDTDEDFQFRITVVNERPTADFTFSPQDPNVGEEVTFDAAAATDPDGSIVEYRWDFDGDSTIENVTTDPVTTHTYNSQGGKTLILTVEDDDGATDRAFRDTVVGPPGPTARCTATPETVAVGEPVTIDASESSNSDSYEYDFDGDGTPDTDRIGDEQVTTDYAEPNEYTPAVTAYNDTTGETDTADCNTVTVEPENEPPLATFGYTPEPAVATEPTTFDASESSDADGTVIEYRWDFDGDGTIDNVTTDPVTTHTYPASAAPGAATVVLTIEDDDNTTDTDRQDVEIIEPTPEPRARCTASPSEAAVGETVTLDASESANADTYRWDLDGDGTYDTDTFGTPTYEQPYEEPNTYEPVVRVENTSTGETDTAPCGEVVIGGNEPPVARFTPSTRQAWIGATVTFDGRNSTDPDGAIAYYEWDLDDDGTFERNTTRPETNFSYDQTGLYNAVLVVTDDDGATDRTTRDLVVEEPPATVCRVEPRQVEPGGEVRLDASETEDAQFVEFDIDGDGEYERTDETDLQETVPYQEPGEYPVLVRVHREGVEPIVEECGTVTVEGGNLPPRADIDHEPLSAGPGTVITFNASNSRDADGTIVEYRWDFGADGTIDNTTTDPTVTRRYLSPGDYTARVIVVDDDGATDADEDRVPIAVGFGGGLPEIPGALWLIPGILGGAGAGYLACRGRGWRPPDIIPHGFGGGSGGISAYATGTFETPTESETVSISGLGFEPDLLLFTATNNVAAPSEDAGPPDHTDGWTYGCAQRDGDGAFTQTAVSVADDEQATDAAVGSTRDGQALDLLVHDDERANGLAGRVRATDGDGFELAFDAAAFPEGQVDDSYAVMFQAFDLSDTDDVEVGQFLTPTAPGSQVVEFGPDADYVMLMANNVVGEPNTAAVTDGLVGISRGAVAAHGTLDQQVVNSTVDPSGAHRNSYAAFEDRALHLLHGDGDEIASHTTARATLLGDRLELTYHDLPGDPGEEADRTVVTYVAIDTGGDPPVIDHVEAPAPGASRSVELGFQPQLLDVLACGIDRVGEERTVAESPLAFGWSHGTAMPDGQGGIIQHLIQGTLDATAVAGHLQPDPAPDETGTGPAADDGARDTALDGGSPQDGSSAGESADTDIGSGPPPGAIARLLDIDDSGRVTGSDEVRATAFRPAGFDLATTGVGSDRYDEEGEQQPILFYHAWPPAE
jgi:PKD repeat protein